MAITFDGATYAWDSGSSIALWVVSGILLITTTALSYSHPLVTSENRLIPAHFFKRPVLINLAFQMFLVSGVMLGYVYYIPLFFSFTRGDGAMQSGVRLLPFVGLMVFTAILSGAVMPKTGHYMPWYLIGSVLITLGSGLMLSVEVDTEQAKVYGYTILVGAGVGCYLVAGFAVTQALVTSGDVSSAVGFQSIASTNPRKRTEWADSIYALTAQVLGCVVFLAVAGSIFFNTSVNNLTPVLPEGTSTAFIADLVTGTSSSSFKSLSPDLAEKVIVGLTESMRDV